MNHVESDPFKRLSKEAGPAPEVNQPTADLLTQLKNVIDGVRLDNSGLELQDLAIKEQFDLAEVQRLVESLSYTLSELNSLLLNGSRQVLLKYFTEDQIETPGFFVSSIDAIQHVIDLGTSITSSAKISEPIQLLRLKEFTDGFSSSLFHLLEPSHGRGNILNEVISNVSLEEDLSDRLKQFDQIREDFLLFHEHFFRRMFIQISDPHSPVGESLVREVVTFIPGITERLSLLKTFNLGDMAHLNIDSRGKQELLEKITNRVESVGSYADIFADSSRENELAQQALDQSDLKWLSNAVRALGESLVELLSDDEVTW